MDSEAGLAAVPDICKSPPENVAKAPRGRSEKAVLNSSSAVNLYDAWCARDHPKMLLHVRMLCAKTSIRLRVYVTYVRNVARRVLALWFTSAGLTHWPESRLDGFGHTQHKPIHKLRVPGSPRKEAFDVCRIFKLCSVYLIIQNKIHGKYAFALSCLLQLSSDDFVRTPKLYLKWPQSASVPKVQFEGAL